MNREEHEKITGKIQYLFKEVNKLGNLDDSTFRYHIKQHLFHIYKYMEDIETRISSLESTQKGERK